MVMNEDLSVKGVYFPRLVDPDTIEEEALPFNLQLVSRAIRTRNINSWVELEQQVEDIVLAVIANPSEEEFDDGFIPLDSYGVVYKRH
jgi:hypothetical protein